MGHTAAVTDDIQPLVAAFQVLVELDLHIIELDLHAVEQRVDVRGARRDFVEGLDHLDDAVEDALRDDKAEVARRGGQGRDGEAVADAVRRAAPALHQVAEAQDPHNCDR